MGLAARDASPAAAEAFKEADEALGLPLSGLIFEGPEEDMKLTRNTQPAVVATSIALYRALGETPDVAAGHSLGEYAAHVAAGTLSFADAIRTVRLRGKTMQEAVPVGEGAMAAVLKADRATVESACATAAEATGQVCEAVNYNGPGQIVIAGSTRAVAHAAEELKAARARVMPLPVSAPFHSSLMKPAEEKLAPELRGLPSAAPAFPVYTNVDAAPVESAGAAIEALIRQVSRPVRWETTVRRMADDGVTLFVEVGPGKVLTGLVGRIAKGATRVTVNGPEQFEAAREAIAAARSGGES